MPDMAGPNTEQSTEQGKVGVLLVNLGTPDSPDYWAVRRYLSEFLSDPRVIELPKFLWQLVLQGPILTFRPARSARAYRKIWLEDGSPLLVHTRRLASRLQAQIGSETLLVDFAMTYGNPSIASKIEALRARGCDRICVVALYPQYSATTTASVYDRTFAALKTIRWQPAIRTAAAFYDRPAYIAALASSVQDHIDGLEFVPDRVLLSYHGIPKAYCDKGDPYYDHCLTTTKLVAKHLGWPDGFGQTVFQSRFGRAQWLQPYTGQMLETLPAQGVRKLVMVSPAFMADCLETLEELAIDGKAQFEAAGGTHFSLVPCLNDSDGAVDVLVDIVARETAGWAG